MNHNFNGMDDKLDQALARLAVGVPVEIILAEAGDDAEQLRPLLEIAGQVAGLKSTIPLPPPDASLQKLLAHGQKLAGPASSPAAPAAPPARWLVNLFTIFNGGFRLATAMATAMLLFFVISGTLFVAAQRSLPGDALYRLKQAAEQVQLDLAGDTLRQEQLTQTFNQRRRVEVETLLQQGKSAEVTFESQVQTVNAGAINLDGLTVQLGPETNIVGQLTAGARVQVEVRTLPPTGLLALTVTVLEPGPPPTPSPTPTFTVQPAPTLPKAQATDTLPRTATPPKAQATDSISLPPTPSPTPMPTARPTEPPPLSEDNLNDNSPDDDFNQNGDDNFNDNTDGDNFNDNANDDNFNDNGDEFDDNDQDSNSNDNGGDENSNEDDHSGSGGSSNNDNSDDNNDDNDGSSSDNDSNDGGSDDNDNS
jgi:hypothetical protein